MNQLNYKTYLQLSKHWTCESVSIEKIQLIQNTRKKVVLKEFGKTNGCANTILAAIVINNNPSRGTTVERVWG